MKHICNRRVLGWSLFALVFAGLAWVLYAWLPPEPRWVLRGPFEHGGITPNGKMYITRTVKGNDLQNLQDLHDDVLVAPELPLPVGPVQYWDIATGEQVEQVLGDRGPVWHVGFSTDCKQLAAVAPATAGAIRCELRYLDLTAGCERHTVFDRPRAPQATWQPWISPGGGLMLLQDWNDLSQEVYVYETASLRLLASATHPQGSGISWKWTPDGNAVYLYTADANDDASLRRIASDGESMTCLKGAGECLTLSPDGKILLSSSLHRLLLWDLPAGTRRGTIPLDGDDWRANQASFTPDGRTLVIQTGNRLASNTLGVWDVNAARWLGRVPFMLGDGPRLVGPNAVVVREAYGRLAAYQLRPFARLWQYEAKQVHAGEVMPAVGRLIALSPMPRSRYMDIPGRLIKSEARGDRLLLLDTRSGAPILDFALDAEAVHSWLSRGKYLLVHTAHDRPSERGPIRAFIEDHLLSLLIAMRPDPFARTSSVRVFDVTTGGQRCDLKCAHIGEAAAALTQDGQALVLHQAASLTGRSDAVAICYDIPPRRPWRFILGIPLALGAMLLAARFGWRRIRPASLPRQRGEGASCMPHPPPADAGGSLTQGGSAHDQRLQSPCARLVAVRAAARRSGVDAVRRAAAGAALGAAWTAWPRRNRARR